MSLPTNKEDELSTVIDNQHGDIITRRIKFKKNTLRNLVTIASREYFDSKLKQDEILSLMLDKIIAKYYNDYWQENK